VFFFFSITVGNTTELSINKLGFIDLTKSCLRVAFVKMAKVASSIPVAGYKDNILLNINFLIKKKIKIDFKNKKSYTYKCNKGLKKKINKRYDEL